MASTSGACVGQQPPEQAADEEVALGREHRLLAVDVEVALRARRQRDLALLVREPGQQRQEPLSVLLEEIRRRCVIDALYSSEPFERVVADVSRLPGVLDAFERVVAVVVATCDAGVRRPGMRLGLRDVRLRPRALRGLGPDLRPLFFGLRAWRASRPCPSGWPPSSTRTRPAPASASAARGLQLRLRDGHARPGARCTSCSRGRRRRRSGRPPRVTIALTGELRWSWRGPRGASAPRGCASRPRRARGARPPAGASAPRARGSPCSSSMRRTRSSSSRWRRSSASRAARSAASLAARSASTARGQLVLLLADAIVLDVAQLFQRKEDRILTSLGHRPFPGNTNCPRASTHAGTLARRRSTGARDPT